MTPDEQDDEAELVALQSKLDALTTFMARMHADETFTPGDLEQMYQLRRELKIKAVAMSKPENRREVYDLAETCGSALDSLHWNMIWPDDL
jgi:hypothetical protein